MVLASGVPAGRQHPRALPARAPPPAAGQAHQPDHDQRHQSHDEQEVEGGDHHGDDEEHGKYREQDEQKFPHTPTICHPGPSGTVASLEWPARYRPGPGGWRVRPGRGGPAAGSLSAS